MTRIYIAGPMSNLPGLNFPAFHAEAAKLRAQGFDVVNPAEINSDPTMGWVECMRRDIPALCTCDAIHMLPGWKNSKGATLEHHIAEQLNMAICLPQVPVVQYPKTCPECDAIFKHGSECSMSGMV